LFYEEKDFIELICVWDYSAVPSVGRTIEAALHIVPPRLARMNTENEF
jgi:hypothetical protein